MIELKGKYNNAIIYTDNVEETAISQVINLCNQEFVKNSKIRMMPDIHSGAGCTIGTTMTITDKIVPNLVGVDVGCGIEVAKISNKDIDFYKLDKVIRKYVPSGQNIKTTEHKYNDRIDLEQLKCKNYINLNRAKLSLGTLGGGNHFIEVNTDKNGNYYICVHSGSRYLGKQMAEYYQNLAINNIYSNNKEKQELIKKLKEEGREKEIQNELNKIKSKSKMPKELCYLEGDDYFDYLHDMVIVQYYAELNRKAIIETIANKMEFDILESFTTIHNYIDVDNKILRKGSVSAQSGERLIIPINMRDGSLICVGKGNPEWNYSAPHGAGRVLSRSKAKELISIEEYIDSMKDKGIWTTSVCESTIDESPMVYKPIEEIMNNIKDTVDIVDVIKPVYNYKAN